MTEAASDKAPARLTGALRWLPVWRRNFRVWQRLAGPALLGNIGEPLLYLVALGYGLGRFVGEVGGFDYVTFLASGFVCASAMNTASFEGMYSGYTRMAVQQTWTAMLHTPLSVRDVLLGEAVWAATKAAISAAAILLVAALLGVVADWRALWVLPLALLLGGTFASLALVMTALSRSYDFFMYYFTLWLTPMLLISGVFFPADQLPQPVAMAAAALPLSHGVALVRPLMVGEWPQALLLHLSVLLAYGALGFWVAHRLVARRLLR